MKHRLGASEVIELGRSRKWSRFGAKGRYLPGWSKKASERTRHGALREMTEREGCRTAIRKLVQLANVTRDAATEKKARTDAKWLHKQGFCKLKTKK